MSRSSITTHAVRLLLGVAHTSSHVRVDGELQRLEEEATVEGNILNIDRLVCIVDSGLSRFGVTCNDSLVVCLHLGTRSDEPLGMSLKRTRPFFMRPIMQVVVRLNEKKL
jgi:hypothetical protein